MKLSKLRIWALLEVCENWRIRRRLARLTAAARSRGLEMKEEDR